MHRQKYTTRYLGSGNFCLTNTILVEMVKKHIIITATIMKIIMKIILLIVDIIIVIIIVVLVISFGCVVVCRTEITIDLVIIKNMCTAMLCAVFYSGP
jgi:hypothetical protein